MSSIGRHKIIKLGCNPIGRLFIFVGLSSSEISQYFLRSLPGSRSQCTTVMVVKKYHDGSSNIINCSMLINESYNMSSLRELWQIWSFFFFYVFFVFYFQTLPLTKYEASFISTLQLGTEPNKHQKIQSSVLSERTPCEDGGAWKFVFENIKVKQKMLDKEWKKRELKCFVVGIVLWGRFSQREMNYARTVTRERKGEKKKKNHVMYTTELVLWLKECWYQTDWAVTPANMAEWMQIFHVVQV